MNKTVIKQIPSTVNRWAGSKRISLIICLFAGMAGAVPYYFESLFAFTFISLFLLFYVISQQKRKQNRVFLPFFCYFIGFYVPLYLFLSELYPFDRFGFTENQAIFVVICSCALIPLIHALVEAFVMHFSKWFNSSIMSIVGYGALWVIGEYVLTLGTLAFPWGNIAVSMTGFLPYIQTASLFGKSFISFVTVSGCAALSLAVCDRRKIFALAGCAAIILNTVVGAILWFLPTQKTETVKVAAIQGNVLSNEKWNNENRSEIFERYITLTENAAKNGAEIIVLPESAIPIAFTQNGRIHESLAEIAAEYSTTIVAGIHYYEDGDSYNAVISVMSDGSLSARYDKRHLVPFGEFIPFADTLGELFPFIAEFSSGSGTYIQGNEPTIIETEHGSIAPLVCFDSIFPAFASEAVSGGAEYIAIVTNDSWFNDSSGIYTHLRHAQLRAIENKRYIMRAANTGVSALIDEHGKIIKSSEPLTVDTVYAEVASIEDKTLATLIGDITLYCSFLVVIIIFVYSKRSSLNEKNTATQN